MRFERISIFLTGKSDHRPKDDMASIGDLRNAAEKVSQIIIRAFDVFNGEIKLLKNKCPAAKTSILRFPLGQTSQRSVVRLQNEIPSYEEPR